MTQPWFGPNDYGVGVAPKSRAGWLSLGAYLVVLVAGSLTFARYFEAAFWMVLTFLLLLTAGFFGLVFAKRDRGPWRSRRRGQKLNDDD